jgi:hypothetical protein
MNLPKNVGFSCKSTTVKNITYLRINTIFWTVINLRIENYQYWLLLLLLLLWMVQNILVYSYSLWYVPSCFRPNKWLYDKSRSIKHFRILTNLNMLWIDGKTKRRNRKKERKDTKHQNVNTIFTYFYKFSFHLKVSVQKEPTNLCVLTQNKA